MFNEKLGLEDLVLQKIKDMTRRVALNEPVENMEVIYDTKTHQCCICSGNLVVKRSQYAVGEVIAIAQRYRDVPCMCYRKGICDGDDIEHGWHNKMFVKAEYMPHHIKITNIRVERLQDISDKDCLREGVAMAYIGYYVPHFKCRNWEKESHMETDNGETWKLFPTPKEAFAALINKVSGKGTWEKNPLVFVYEFELVD